VESVSGEVAAVYHRTLALRHQFTLPDHGYGVREEKGTKGRSA